MKQVKLLKEVYKTWDGAKKRCGFENAMAKGEYDRGDKAKFYCYAVVNVGNTWRVARCLPDEPAITTLSGGAALICF